MRTLFFLALGGTITLFVLGVTTDSEVFVPWLLGFLIATVILLMLWILLRQLQRALAARVDLQDARNSGRVRAAMIVGRRQTGLFVNEQPQVEFTLLVDRPESTPFLTKTRKIVSLLDMHDITVGSMMTVAQPSAEHGDVVIVEEPPPTPSSRLTLEAASTAVELPSRSASGSGLLKVGIFGLAFVIGAIGAPYLATPKVGEYVQLIFDGRAGDSAAVDAIDHVVLFEPAELQTSLDALVEELGHDEVYSMTISHVRLTADAPSAPGATTSDEVTIQDHQVLERDPSFIPVVDDPEDMAMLFRVSDVDFDSILAGVSEAQQLAVERGAVNPELARILVTRSHFDLQEVEATVYFEHQHGEEMIVLDAQGQLPPGEQLAQLSEEEQDTYLFDAARAQQAVDEMVAAAASDRIIRLTNHGSHMGLEAYYGDGENAGSSVRTTFSRGTVSDIGDPRAVNVEAAEVFDVDDVDWNMIIAAIPEAQQVMADAGAADTQVTHILVGAKRQPSAGNYELAASIYLSNEAGHGGYIEFNMDSTVNRVHGP